MPFDGVPPDKMIYDILNLLGENGERHCKRVLSRTNTGASCNPLNIKAHSFCVLGALIKLGYDLEGRCDFDEYYMKEFGVYITKHNDELPFNELKQNLLKLTGL